MRELVDLELLAAQFLVLVGNSLDQTDGEFTQLLRVHAGELIVHLHGPRCCHSAPQNNSNFMPRESSPVRRCDTTAIRAVGPAAARC